MEKKQERITEGKVADTLSDVGEKVGEALEKHPYLSGIGTAVGAGLAALGLRKLYRKAKEKTREKLASWSGA